MSGSGKSDTGKALAQTLGAPFIDADDLHTAEHIQRMAQGIPLTDADRGPWLVRLRNAVDTLCEEGHNTVVVACSALRRSYRDVLRDTPTVHGLFVHLAVEQPVLEARLAARQGHFMHAQLLSSQLATLEPPNGEPGTFTVNVSQATSCDQVVAWIQAWLATQP